MGVRGGPCWVRGGRTGERGELREEGEGVVPEVQVGEGADGAGGHGEAVQLGDLVVGEDLRRREWGEGCGRSGGERADA